MISSGATTAPEESVITTPVATFATALGESFLNFDMESGIHPASVMVNNREHKSLIFIVFILLLSLKLGKNLGL